MSLLILGLLMFLGVHSVRIFADDWRTQQVQRLGENRWKGLYSLVSVIGLLLIIYGYGQARLDPTVLWNPPVWTKHLAALLVMIAFVLLVAAYVPGNRIRARLKHPMVLSVKVWALAHLFANGTLADALLFGGFLLWAVFDFRSARRRPVAAAGTALVARGGVRHDAITVALGLAAYVVFALFAHSWLFGVNPY